MSHAITVGDILLLVGIPIGLLILGAVLIAIIVMFNPFRSGH